MQGSHGAVDLAQHVKDKQARELAEYAAAEKQAMAHVAAWDKAMNRAFKGIVSTPDRHRMMIRAAERVDADA